MSEVENENSLSQNHSFAGQMIISGNSEHTVMEAVAKNYLLCNKIGQGSFGSVFRAVHKLTKTEVSIKVIDKNLFVDDSDAKVHIDNEAIIMKELNHPLIAQLYEIIETESFFCIVMEYARNGDLLGYVNTHSDSLSEKNAKKIFTQLVYALQYLHNVKKIAHRDLKPENILLDSDDNVKIIDFGFSKHFNKNLLFSSVCGSPAYVAPEVITGQKYNQAADIWSIGIILYALVIGQLPFNGDNIQVQLERVAFSEPYYPSKMSDELTHLLKRLLTKNYEERISIDEILQHKWITETRECNDTINIFNGEVSKVDNLILTQMNYLGLDTEGIESDLVLNEMNERTVSYRLLQRAKIARLVKSSQIKTVLRSVMTCPTSPILKARPDMIKKGVRCLTRATRKENETTIVNSINPNAIEKGTPVVQKNQRSYVSTSRAVKPKFSNNNEIFSPKKGRYLHEVETKPFVIRF